MNRWVKAFALLAAIGTSNDLPPFVWGNLEAIAYRLVFCGLAYWMAYMAVSSDDK